MKNHKLLIALILLIVILIVVATAFSDDEKDYISETSIKEITKMQDKEKDFILYIKQTNCEHCRVFTPRFISALKETNLKAYSLNITDLSDKDKEKYDDMFDIDGTPTVLFFNKGKENKLVKIEGEQTKEKIKSKLRTAGFTK